MSVFFQNHHVRVVHNMRVWTPLEVIIVLVLVVMKITPYAQVQIINVIIVWFSFNQQNRNWQFSDNDCSSNAYCIDKVKAFTCKCNPGYKGDGWTVLVSLFFFFISLLFSYLFSYLRLSSLYLLVPSFSIHAHPLSLFLYLLLSPLFCQNGVWYNLKDIDECRRGQACDPVATCTITPGSFNCSCPSGYTSGSFCIGIINIITIIVIINFDD